MKNKPPDLGNVVRDEDLPLELRFIQAVTKIIEKEFPKIDMVERYKAAIKFYQSLNK